MNGGKLEFREIGIRRMPGFREGGFTVRGLGAGINLIYGPNASGKSTVARAIQSVLWPKAAAPSRASLIAHLVIDGDEWNVDLDSGHVRCQRLGIDEAAPVVAPAETRDRYYLSLHQLLAIEDGRDLAAVIQRESSGGYDLGAAAEACGFQAKAGAPVKASKVLRKARERVRRAGDAQKTLREKENWLETLEERKRQAVRAGDLVPVLTTAISHVKAMETRHAAVAALNGFAREIGQLTGRELEELERIESRKEEDRRRRQVAYSELEKSKRARARCELPSKGLPDSLTAELRSRLSELRTVEQAYRERAAEVERLHAEARTERARLGEGFSDSQLEALAAVGPETVAAFSDLAERIERVNASNAGLEELEGWIGRATVTEGAEERRTQARELSEWLCAAAYDPTDAERAKLLSAIGGAGLIVGGILVAVLAHVAGWLGVLLGIGVVALGWWPRTRENVRDRIRESWASRGLEAPRAWEPAAVEERLAAIQREIAVDTLQSERLARWADLAERRERHHAELEKLIDDRGELAAGIGLVPDLEHPSLVHLVGRLARWQDVTARRAGALRARDEAAAQRDALVADVSRQLKVFGVANVADSAQLAGVTDDLERRQARWEKASAERAAAQRTIEETEARIEAADREIETLFERCGLGVQDEEVLRDRISQMQAYSEARQAVRDAERESDRLSARLGDQGAHGRRTLQDLREELASCEEAVASIESLDQEIGEIRAKLADAKEDHDLEEALADHDRARIEMQEARERDIAALVGNELFESVRRESRDLERPRVFHRARELFARITQGQYRLEMADGDSPSFVAIDTITGRGHAIEELSSATRVQLFLSVRVAFIEEQEQGPALPLLLDETLGNSDDRRAQAIINAAIEIAREGRQVFYFTAQDDEAGKWIGFMDGDDTVPLHQVDLAEVRSLAESRRGGELPVQPPRRTRVPEPAGMNRIEFGERLKVPRFDPRAENVGGLHLWHVIDDVDVLHRLLSLDISRWGQLQNLIQHGGRALVPGDEATYERARAAAQLFEKASQYWRIGRGRRVDRDALIASGAVTGTFLEQVAELAEEVDGDAGRLIAALERRAVKRFPTQAIDNLRESLLRSGHLDQAAPLSADEIRSRLLASSSSFIRDDVLSTEKIDELLRF